MLQAPKCLFSRRTGRTRSDRARGVWQMNAKLIASVAVANAALGVADTALAEPTLDTTKPTITGPSVPAASGAGWNNGPVADPATVSRINIDTIYPTVTFTGVGLYSLLQTVTVTCVPGDALSGIASSTCSAPPPALAWTLGLGPHPVTSAVTDNAGNALFAATVFSVRVTYDDLCGLTERPSRPMRERRSSPSRTG